MRSHGVRCTVVVAFDTTYSLTRRLILVAEGGYSPENFASNIGILPLHWHVYSVGSYSEFSFSSPLSDCGAQKYSGVAHLEKNWGRSFPSAWIWAQAASSDGRHSLIVSGGDAINIPLFPKVFLLAWHSDNEVYNFGAWPFPNGVKVLENDSQQGRVVVQAKHKSKRIVATLFAPVVSSIYSFRGERLKKKVGHG
jgi:hypothetical protein